MSLQVYAAPFQWRLFIFIGEDWWHRVLEANKKQVPWKSYSLKIRIDSVNQILKNKEKVMQTCDINILTRILDWKIPCVYIPVYHMIKNRGPGLYNSLSHADNRKYFSGLSLRNWMEVHMFYLEREEGKIWRCSCWEKDNFIMISEFKYGQTRKICSSPLSLSLYSTLKSVVFKLSYYSVCFMGVQSCSFSLVCVFNAISHYLDYLDTSWKQKLHCYNDPQLKQIVNKCKFDSKK